MKKAVRVVVFVLALGVFCLSAYKIVGIVVDRHKADEHYESYSTYITEETVAIENKETQAQSATAASKPEAICPISVDFGGLKAQYSDVVGYLYFGSDFISYPVVKGRDNYYYLNRLPNGVESDSGSIYADNRVTQPSDCDNYIIYGHNMLNGSMFGSLSNYEDQSFYDEHPYFFYITEQGTYTVDIIAGCSVIPDFDIYKTEFTDEQMKATINEIVSCSTFVSDVSYEDSDKIMTLSTCSDRYSDTRYIIVGVIR